MFRLKFAILAVAAAASHAEAQAFTRMINFGDSLSDVGNTQKITFGFSPGSNYWNGRYSNGLVWAEDMAASLRLPTVVASSNGGLDYAVGGSRTGSGSVNVSPFPFVTISLPNAGTQIESFLKSKTLGNDDLVTLWSGANDLLDGQSETAAAANMRTHVERLVGAGAKNILVINLPPLGETPRYRNTADRAAMTARASTFNSTLASGLAAVSAAHADVNLFQADIFSFFGNALSNPAAYGFTNVTDAALRSDGTVAPDADGYLFYDTIHPTRVGHDVIGDFAFERVTARTWANASNDVWGSTTSWAQHRVPDATSAVTLAAGTSFETTLNTPATVRKLTVTTNATLRLSQTTLAVTDAPLTVGFAGTITGRGTIAGSVNVTAGTVSPGDFMSQLGQIIVNGTLTQQPGARLIADLSATDADRVSVNGSAHLNGTLTVRFTGGYLGLPGDLRTLLTYSTGDGSFTSIVNATNYRGLSFTPIYNATSMAVRLAATPGDANLDASVNFADLVVLAQHYGVTAAQDWLDGDFNHSGGVDFADLVALAQNYNGAPAAGLLAAGLEASAAFAEDWALAQSLVPEPATLATLMLLPLPLKRRR